MKTVLSAILAAAAIAAAGAASAQPAGDRVARGEYLVSGMGCHDCHTPWEMGPAGPQPDMTRALSGHPEGFVVEAPAELGGPWLVASTGTNTAWSGPWGVSFTANLTPDPETGVLEDYTEEQFVQAMRTGRHKGQGRPILPPMPWPAYGNLTDEDLGAMFAYLRQIPAIRNDVPDPIAPAQ